MARHPFNVHVAQIRHHPGTSVDVDVAGPIEDLVVGGVRVPEGAEVHLAGTVTSYLGGVEIHATVSAPWAAECRRCGRPVEGTVEAEISERATPEGPGGGDEEVYPLADDLDLTPVARDAVLLALPLAPLCRPDCAGLCPECGADRNEGECGCTPPQDPRWAALDELAGLGDEGGAGRA